jgi:hypothetical protein
MQLLRRQLSKAAPDRGTWQEAPPQVFPLERVEGGEVEGVEEKELNREISMELIKVV